MSYTGNYAVDKELRAKNFSNLVDYGILENGNIIVKYGECVLAFWNVKVNHGTLTIIWASGAYQRERNGFNRYKTLNGWLKGVEKNLGITIIT